MTQITMRCTTAKRCDDGVTYFKLLTLYAYVLHCRTSITLCVSLNFTVEPKKSLRKPKLEKLPVNRS